MLQPRRVVTVITPIYNEEANLRPYVEAVRAALFSQLEYDIHVLFVDDGSTDGSWPLITEISAGDPRFRGIRLSRNFGAHVALSAGFHQASGAAVVTLACDLQDPPEVILKFLDQWRRGARIVWGRRRQRADDAWRILASNLFYELARRFAMPRNSQFATGSFLLADRRVVECFRQFREHNRLTFALIAWTGFDQAVVEYDRRPRLRGQSGWNRRRLVKAAYDTFISFSELPAKLMAGLGLGVFLTALPLALYTLVCYLTGHPQRGWTSLMLATFVFFGLQFMMMGLMGEYLHRIYTESVGRPLFFVSDTTDSAEASARHAA